MGLLEATMKAGAPQSFEFYDDKREFVKHLNAMRNLSNRYEIKQLRQIFDTITPSKGMTPVEYAQWRNERDENLIYEVKINGEWVAVPISESQKQRSIDYYSECLKDKRKAADEALESSNFFAKRGESEQAELWLSTMQLSKDMARDYEEIIETLKNL